MIWRSLLHNFWFSPLSFLFYLTEQERKESQGHFFGLKKIISGSQRSFIRCIFVKKDRARRISLSLPFLSLPLDIFLSSPSLSVSLSFTLSHTHTQKMHPFQYCQAVSLAVWPLVIDFLINLSWKAHINMLQKRDTYGKCH